MTFNLDSFSQTPLVVDLLHLILLALVVVLLILWLRSRSVSELEAEPESQTAERLVEPEPAPAAAPLLQAATPDSALQLLSLLQAEGRFVDFLHEDLSGFSDEEIGAVARVVHEGSRKTLNNYFQMTPLREEEEESRIIVEAGFDPSKIRLTGQVSGQAPFNGTLIHRGWQVTDVNLPKLAEGHDTRILTPAEVEL